MQFSLSNSTGSTRIWKNWITSPTTNLQATLDIFEDLDVLELKSLRTDRTSENPGHPNPPEKVDENALERVIQEYLFDHLWLLDPSWERTEGTELMEKRVDKLFEDVDASLTNEEKRGRLDIAYRKTAGQHVIIELKRPERVVSISEIIKQLEKYTSGMLKLLRAQGATNEPVEIVLLLGQGARRMGERGWQGSDDSNSFDLQCSDRILRPITERCL